MSRELCVATAVLFAVTGWAAVALADDEPVQLSMDAYDAFEQGMGAWDVRYDADAGGVVLADRHLIEDDGPGAKPYNTRHWYHLEMPDTLALDEPGVRAKKILHLERGDVAAARLLLGSASTHAIVSVNGQRLRDQSGRYRTVPPELLKAGDNRVVLQRGERDTLAIISRRADILRNAPERAANPARSFKSTDAGESWQAVDGEFYVRLEITQYAAEGHFISPVIELSGQGAGLLDPVRLGGLELTYDAIEPDGTAIDIRVRTGPTPVHDPATWGGWRAADAIEPGEHAYAQFKAVLSSDTGRATPVLRRVSIVPELEADAPDWAGALRARSMHNPELRYTSAPFTYEDFNHPALVELREKYNLDDVVADAETEFEKILLLRQFVNRNVRYDPPVRHYPAWDAREILEIGSGFCVQRAITRMQVFQAMGLNARFVFGYHPGPDAGHEVTEVWSNEYDKWILIDETYHHVDPETHEPLSMLEINERVVRNYYGDDKMITAGNRPSDQSGENIWTVMGTDPTPDPETRQQRDLNPDISPRWNRWTIIRMMPRNDFLSRTHPLPANQGFGWEWSDYLAWQSPQTPTSLNTRYNHVTDRESDWQWTLNRVRFDVTPTSETGVVQVQMGTQTPGFEAYEVRHNGGDWRDERPRFTQALEPGLNRIEMRSRNNAGVSGAVSHVEIEYQP